MEEANAKATGELYTLQLPSKVESISALEALVEEVADKYQVSEDTFANMMTCLNEAAMNAILHGNKLDEKKTVYVNVEADSRRIVWTVADEGPGFNYNNLPDPTEPDRLEELTGRGVFILKHLADQCIFNAAGNEVELHFKI
ncbi:MULTISPECIES: ATP-binding protein [unclassified Mucilaginibacter]|uniref:ATP-binding protein n=1 Tax=unclassified Mucilaginibacter TaxID=2617802 RepID=UPI000969FC03|nr:MULTISPECIES: ATP-binding protein [unclassified Mucilaginibacter]HEK19230.1 ATP-binding protein [Bacteroidota bacterium]OJW17409.1 MAG: ATP-binding protein [Mucilaginibacter sp. 44-25]PAW92759.1 ATP-binding protein [Mucilaginibacter sp. MD40]PLW90625.1 MAG: ATP-binding protein [Mucilaginibacter sp.]PMP65953.1 MAG: ATP-binding protein [Mucilaginibacter sp.]